MRSGKREASHSKMHNSWQTLSVLKMDAGLCIKTVVFLLHFQQYCSWKLPYKQYYDCNNPWINYTDDVQPYTEIGGFRHKEMMMVYDKRNRRTEFIAVVVDVADLRAEPTMCEVNRTEAGVAAPDLPACLVPDILGGTCDTVNVFPLNANCTMTLWTMFQSLTKQAVLYNKVIKFCTRLIYEKDGDRRPTQIVSRYYTYPDNDYLHSIGFNNPVYDECRQVPHRVN